MTRTTPGAPPGPSPTDTPAAGASVAARWISGLGAFLLVAAAATFVAVRWDQIPREAKFGALLALTGLCLGADRWLRGQAPVTATTLFHVGVLLLPIDVAAAGVRLGWEWPWLLLSIGGTVVLSAGPAARMRSSVVLAAMTAVGVVLIAGGLGAVSGLPAHLVLAGFALMATLAGPLAPVRAALRIGDASRLQPAVILWAGLAGLATPLAGASAAGWPAAGVLYDLGLASPAPHPWAAATGLCSAAALFVVATRQRSVPVALLGLASLAVGTAMTWSAMDVGPAAHLIGLTLVVLLVELAAWHLRDDPFWSRPCSDLATLAELLAGVMTVGFGLVVLAAPWIDGAGPDYSLAATLLGLAWLVKVARGVPGDVQQRWPFTHRPVGLRGLELSAAAVGAAAAGILLTAGNPVAPALIVAMTGVTLAATPLDLRPGTARNRLAAGLFLTWAPVVAGDTTTLLVVLSGLGSLALAVATVDTARWTGTVGLNRLTSTLGYLSLAPLGIGAVGTTTVSEGSTVWGMAGAVLGCWVLAAIFDTASIRPAPLPQSPYVQFTMTGTLPAPLPLAWIPRAAALAPLAVMLWAGEGGVVTATETAAVAALLAGAAIVDAVRLRRPELLTGAALAAPVLVAAMVMSMGATVGEAGVAVTSAGLVWLLIASLLSGRRVADGLPGDRPVPGTWAQWSAWARWTLSGAAVSAVVGLVLSMDSASGGTGAFAANLIVTGIGGLALARALDHQVLALGSLATIGSGSWGLLDAADVVGASPYLAPAAGLWLLGGWLARRRDAELTSWLAHAPAVLLLGGGALVDRLADGSGGYALLAGVVAMVAVLVGAAGRLAGPLFTGTGLLLAVTVHETLGASARVPTWAWLAGGGVTLLVAGLVMERQGTGPVETGRRLVDLIGERFS